MSVAAFRWQDHSLEVLDQRLLPHNLSMIRCQTPEDVAEVIDAVAKFVPKSNIVATTNCGMAPMHRYIAEAKLMALGAGARLARLKFG